MWEKIRVVFTIPELRQKILLTLLFLAVYRVGYQIPLPIVDTSEMKAFFERAAGGGLGQLLQQAMLFSASSLSQATIFGLGIMPYISASIIFQLLASVWKPLEELQKEGEAGRKKINEYTRYATVVLCLGQSLMYVKYLAGAGVIRKELLDPATESLGWGWTFTAVMTMTAGSTFLMWLGEQIDEYGVGNGISLIIMAGIIDRMPWAVGMLIKDLNMKVGGEGVGPGKLVFLVAAFVGVVAGTILISQAQRRIPIQQAKMMRGHRMYGGQRSYIPLRVNGGGVMPIVFASSFMMFPPIVIEQLSKLFPESTTLLSIAGALRHEAFTYNVLYMLLIFVFAYFWVTVQFQPREWAKNLRDSGSFIPGLRPGKRTADYLETVMMRITYYGASFLAVIAVVPTLLFVWLDIDWRVATFLGGTGLLIVVSVSLDLVQKLEAGLLMHSYEGFSEAGRIKGAYT